MSAILRVSTFAVTVFTALTLTVAAHAQYAVAIDQLTFSTPAGAANESLNHSSDHVSILPLRLSSNPITGGNFASYLVQWQPLTTDTPACSTEINHTSELPEQIHGIICVTTLLGYKVQNAGTFGTAKTFYDALPALVKATAYIIATPATNAPYFVAYQDSVTACQ